MDSEKYYVIWPDGQKFGPADVATLNAWAAENRIKAGTNVEPESSPGNVMVLENVPGIQLPAAQPATPTTPSSSVGTGADPLNPNPVQPSSPYGSPSSPAGGSASSSPYGTPQGQPTPSASPYNPSGQPSPYNPSGQPSPYSQAPGAGQQQPYANYPRQNASSGDDGQTEATVSFVLSAIGIVTACCCGWLLGIVAIFLGYKAKEKGNRNGQTAFILACVVTGISVLWVALSLILNGPEAFQNYSQFN